MLRLIDSLLSIFSAFLDEGDPEAPVDLALLLELYAHFIELLVVVIFDGLLEDINFFFI